MLIIERDSLGIGFRIRTKPAHIKVHVLHASDVAQVVNHYYAIQRCLPGCPLCRQLAAEAKEKAQA